MPFMQAIGMEKDELVQALGVFFTTATLALTFKLTAVGLLTPANVVPGAVGPRHGLCRHVHRPIGAGADAGRGVPPLVPDRDDFARSVSGRQRAGEGVCLRELPRLQHGDADAEIDEEAAEGTVDPGDRTLGLAQPVGGSRGERRQHQSTTMSP